MSGLANEPEILILMSAYNGSLYIKQQIDSILNQSDVDIKLLIRDDKSKDNGETIEILRGYKLKYPDIIHIIEGDENLGFAQSFSELLKLGLEDYPTIKYFAFSDQDDVWEKEKLIRGFIKLRSEEEKYLEGKQPILYCSNTELVDKDLKHIGYYWHPEEIKISKGTSLVQSFATGCTFIFNRYAANLYCTHYSSKYPSAHDYFMYQTCVFFGKVIWDYKSFIKYRQHGSNMIGHPNLYNRLINRLRNLYKISHKLELQNKEFYNSFFQEFSNEDRKLLEEFLSYRSSFTNKIRLMFNRNIKYTNLESNLMYYLKILLGRL